MMPAACVATEIGCCFAVSQGVEEVQRNERGQKRMCREPPIPTQGRVLDVAELGY